MLSALSALRNLDLQRELDPTAASATSTATASSTTATASGSLSTSDSDATSSYGSPLSQDTVQLLKDLATGDVSAAKADVTKLQKDLKAQGGSTSSDNALTKLLTSISKSLDAGSASDALSSLAGYLIQTGNTTGTLVNTTA